MFTYYKIDNGYLKLVINRKKAHIIFIGENEMRNQISKNISVKNRDVIEDRLLNMPTFNFSYCEFTKYINCLERIKEIVNGISIDVNLLNNQLYAIARFIFIRDVHLCILDDVDNVVTNFILDTLKYDPNYGPDYNYNIVICESKGNKMVDAIFDPTNYGIRTIKLFSRKEILNAKDYDNLLFVPVGQMNDTLINMINRNFHYHKNLFMFTLMATLNDKDISIKTNKKNLEQLISDYLLF